MNVQQNASAGQKAGDRGYRRQVKNILIHKPMQREFMFVVIVLFMISMFAIGFIIHYTIREAAFGGGFRFGKINPYEVLSDVSYQLILWVSCVLFATLVVIGSFGLFFLHRIAGPVFRFQTVLRRINHGHNLQQFRLREGDFFIEVAEELNTLIQAVQAQNGNIKKLSESIEALLNIKDPTLLHQAVLDLKALVSQAQVVNKPRHQEA